MDNLYLVRLRDGSKSSRFIVSAQTMSEAVDKAEKKVDMNPRSTHTYVQCLQDTQLII